MYTYVVMHYCVLVLNDQNQNTPLHVAAGNGHDAVVKNLASRKANVNAVNKVSNT